MITKPRQIFNSLIGFKMHSLIYVGANIPGQGKIRFLSMRMFIFVMSLIIRLPLIVFGKLTHSPRIDRWLTMVDTEIYGFSDSPVHSFVDLFPHSPVDLPMGGDEPQPFIVIDNFYDDPEQIRQFALQCQYIEHRPLWWVSAWESGPAPGLRGDLGTRYNGADLKKKLEDIIKRKIIKDTWELAGDGWNGAFHLRFGCPSQQIVGGIHNHYGKVSGSTVAETQFGWTGLVYLSPKPNTKTGTSIWIDKKTKRCYAEGEHAIWLDTSQAYLAFDFENVYNRLVLMDSRILHRAENGFGLTPETARLVQTFFFDVER